MTDDTVPNTHSRIWAASFALGFLFGSRVEGVGFWRRAKTACAWWLARQLEWVYGVRRERPTFAILSAEIDAMTARPLEEMAGVTSTVLLLAPPGWDHPSRTC